ARGRDAVTRPTLDELRAVSQPASTLARRSGEHWLARLWLRGVSLRITRVLIRTPVTANQLTGLMIVIGLLGAVAAGLPGLGWALVAAALIVAYFVLDLCDGEVARWRGATSVTGVYLDRVGHYVVEAALLAGYGFRAGGQEVGGWTTLGLLGALLVVLVKAETDLVDVARARAGLPVAADGQAELRSTRLAHARRLASVLRLHQVTGALESVALLVLAAAIDFGRGDLVFTRTLLVVLVAVAGTMVVVHLTSVLLSRRLL
ncbi:MAG: CDP-alcohol phosphatidyltransferase family protein, partial [Jiangellaceae bacterium]